MGGQQGPGRNGACTQVRNLRRLNPNGSSRCIAAAAHGGVQAEALHVGAQVLMVPGEQLDQSGKDLVQHSLQRFIGWRRYLDEFRRAVGTRSVHAVQHQAVQVDVQPGGRPEALNERDDAVVGLACLESGLPKQVAREHTVHDLRHDLGWNTTSVSPAIQRFDPVPGWQPVLPAPNRVR
jgi:hypothetical protein